jgi:hypothetical protein
MESSATSDLEGIFPGWSEVFNNCYPKPTMPPVAVTPQILPFANASQSAQLFITEPQVASHPTIVPNPTPYGPGMPGEHWRFMNNPFAPSDQLQSVNPAAVFMASNDNAETNSDYINTDDIHGPVPIRQDGNLDSCESDQNIESEDSEDDTVPIPTTSMLKRELSPSSSPILPRRKPGRPPKALLAAQGRKRRKGSDDRKRSQELHNHSATQSRARVNEGVEGIWKLVPPCQEIKFREKNGMPPQRSNGRPPCRAMKLQIAIAYLKEQIILKPHVTANCEKCQSAIDTSVQENRPSVIAIPTRVGSSRLGKAGDSPG